MAIETPTAEVLSAAASANYWRSLCPDLHISNKPYSEPFSAYDVPADALQEGIEHLRAAGYLRTQPVIPKPELEQLLSCVIRVMDQGFPPAFAFMYDEFWRVFQKLSNVVVPILGKNYKIARNMWIWYVDEDSSGFSPHRDIPHKVTLNENGLPRVGSFWIPLTDVTPDHSCINVLPTNFDPNIPGSLNDFSVSQENIQNIRALPALAGSVLCWNGQILHWGSRGSHGTTHPRISMGANLYQLDDLTDSSTSIIGPSLTISFEYRLAVICRLVLIYDSYELAEYSFDEQLLKFCRGKLAPLHPSNKNANYSFTQKNISQSLKELNTKS